MTTRHSLSKLGIKVNDHQNASVTIDRWTYFQAIVLDQLIEIATLDVFQVKPDVTRFVKDLLEREALIHILAHAAANARPGLTFLDPCDHLRNTLMSQGIISAKENLMLVKLRHHNQARMFVQRTLCGWVLYTKNSVLVYDEKLLPLFGVVTCKLAYILRENVRVNGLVQDQLFDRKYMDVKVLRQY